MKKRLLILLLITAVIGSVNGQTGLYTGLDLGFNSIWIANQNNYGYTELQYERTFGFIGGAFVGYRMDDTYGVQIGLNYVKMGQDYFDIVKDFGPPDTVQNKPTKVDTYRFVDLNYLHIPILFRYMTERDKKRDEIINLHITIGPTIGFLLSADQYYQADVANDNNLVTLDNDTIPEAQIPDFRDSPGREEDKEYFSGVDFGVQASFGVDIYVAENMFFAPALNVYYGLTDLNSKPTREIEKYNGASHNFYMGLNVGFIVNLGEE